MQVGISTASLFKRYSTEEGLKLFGKSGVDTAEVFLESFCEYNKRFGKKLAGVKGKTKINSVHTLTTQFEPQLFSENSVAQKDSFKLLDGVLKAAKAVGAEKYTFHGAAIIKKTPFTVNFEKYAKNTQRVIDACSEYAITLAYENVHWCYMNYVGFFSELKKRTVGLKATLDIKQARQSGIKSEDLIEEIGSDIVTVHLSDITAEGKMCLPLAKGGTTDFADLLKKLKEKGFDGALLIESYYSDYDSIDELFDSYRKLKKLASEIF